MSSFNINIEYLNGTILQKSQIRNSSNSQYGCLAEHENGKPMTEWFSYRDQFYGNLC